jgi:hypothetical protein
MQRLRDAGVIQAKLHISQPSDPYEQEADRVAETVMRMPAPPSGHEAPCAACASGGSTCPKCAARSAGRLHRKAMSESAHAPGGARSPDSIFPGSGRGRPLDAPTRSFFEPRFGRDFSFVRVHVGAEAAESARSVNALAFTLGRDVVFADGAYAPHTQSGRRLLAHELTHVVQQRTERRASALSDTNPPARQLGPIAASGGPIMQRDLARPPSGAPDPLVALAPAEIPAAIAFNQARFADPYSIRVIRDVVGLDPVPAVVDEDLVLAIVEWQAERRMTQDGQIGHATTRSLYLELVAESELRDAILLLMDSYRLPDDPHLHDIRVGTGANCCGAVGTADAVTGGGMGGGAPIEICFCRPRIPRTAAGYDHFVRIAGHELTHVPQRAANIADQHAREFEAFFWEACAGGRAPQLAAAERVNHANIALAHFALIAPAFQTAARIAMRDQLNALVAAGGVGAC